MMYADATTKERLSYHDSLLTFPAWKRQTVDTVCLMSETAHCFAIVDIDDNPVKKSMQCCDLHLNVVSVMLFAWGEVNAPL